MLRCSDCGELVVGPCGVEASAGVSHHLTPDGDIDFDLDADHVAVSPFGDPDADE